jgi:hypothetical protein
MLDQLPKIAVALVIFLVVSYIGIAIANQTSETVSIPADSQFNATVYTVNDTVNDAFSWMPMIVLAIVGGVALTAIYGYATMLYRG